MKSNSWIFLLLVQLIYFGVKKSSAESSQNEQEVYKSRVNEGTVPARGIKSHSYRVYISAHSNTRLSSGTERCSGSIIGDRWIITVAHCNKKNTVMYVYISMKKILSGTQFTIQEKNRYQHPKYSDVIKNNGFSYDYLLLKLDQKLHFNQKINLVPIGSANDISYGKIGTVAGWGGKNDKGILREVQLPILPHDICIRSYTRESLKKSLYPSQFCAGSYQEGKSAVYDEAGAGLVVDGKLVGLFTGNNGNCGHGGCPGVYLSVPQERSWITKVTGI